MSAAALLQKPYNEFFKAAVASAGNHDNNIYNDGWAERYHGLREVAVVEPPKTKAAVSTVAAADGGAKDQVADDEKKDEKTVDDKKDDKKSDEKKDEKKSDDKKDDNKSGEKKDDGKKEEKKDDKKVEEKKTKFEIRVPTNAELAANLKGHLLLVHGEIDNNVHPANTMRLVDALIKANKRFDMLIVPGKRHGFGDYQPYFTQRMWDFFAEHLLNERQSSADIMEKANGNRNK
jgi:hypothetical protein